MSLELKIKQEDSDIISLSSDYIKVVYWNSWDVNSKDAILLKNKIVVLLWKIFKEITDSFLSWNIDKNKVLQFVWAVSNLIWAWLINAKTSIFDDLVIKNKSLAQNEESLKSIKQYINQEIDKRLTYARIEIDNVVDLFRERCIEILLEQGQKTSNMLRLSHGRDKTKIWELKLQNTWLETQVWELQQTVNNQSKTLKRWFAEWRKLNTRVWELETEKSNLSTVISQIEAELARKKRRLKWETLSEKLNWFLGFTREIQTQETRWQQTFVLQQNFDRVENKLKWEINDLIWNINDLRTSLEKAKQIAIELNDELVEEQRKNQVLTTNDERVIKETINKQLTDYFCFLLNDTDFVNITKQEELELSLKMSFYRAKALDIEIYNFLISQINKIEKLYIENFSSSLKLEQIQKASNELKNFINLLQFWKSYLDKAIKAYSEFRT